MKVQLKYLFAVLFLCCVSWSFAQELTVKAFEAAPTDISASQQPRLDLTGMPCGLVKVQLAVAGAQFEGNVIAPVEKRTSEYWVYMTEGSKELKVNVPGFLPLHLHFSDYQISGIVPKATYVLTLSAPARAEAPQTGTLTIRYSPASAMVLIDSQPHQGSNGVVSVPLPVGSHDYIVAANGYETMEGSVKINAGKTVNLPLTLSRMSTSTTSTTALAATTTQPVATASPNVTTPPVVRQAPASTQTFTANGVSFTMVRVEGGTFTMGATAEQGSDAWDDEKPVHEVTLSGYSIGETEVTQALWKAVMGRNRSKFKGADLPVDNVSWDDCQAFITKLNALTGQTFRLPTEAEWEYAARGGNKSQGYKYCGSNTPGDVAWYDGNSGNETHPVKTKSPNELGLYDMSGNVFEWCQDWYGSYSSTAQTNSTGPSTGSKRVIRGGGWDSGARGCRVSYRDFFTPGNRGNGLGLRLVF